MQGVREEQGGHAESPRAPRTVAFPLRDQKPLRVLSRGMTYVSKDCYSCWVPSGLQGGKGRTGRSVSKLFYSLDSRKCRSGQGSGRGCGQIQARSTVERLQDLPLNWPWGTTERQESG